MPTVAQTILQMVGAVGTDTVYGLPGVHNLAFWSGEPQRPRIMSVRHEQTAGYAADGYARSTGRLGVAIVTSGPGAANVLAAFGEAATSGSPVLLVASDVPEAARRRPPRGLLHESPDQGAWFAPMAKAVRQPRSLEAALGATAEAIDIALAHPRGPVYLGIPADILAMDVHGTGPTGPLHPRSSAIESMTDLASVVDRLNASRRPVLWVGGGAVASGAGESIDALAWRLGAPVVTTIAARGILGDGHPLVVDAPPHEPEVADLISGADAMVAIGSGFDGMTTRNWSMPLPDVLVSVNARPITAYEADLELVGDARTVVDELLLRLRPREPWADSPFRLRTRVRDRLSADPRTHAGIELVSAVEQGWPHDANIVCDMSVGGYWVGGYVVRSRARRLQGPIGWGTLGYGLPAAIGAATGGVPTLAVVGDGGIAMGLGELATVAQEQLPITVLIVDDGGYGMLRYGREGRTEGTELLGPEWNALAAAFHLTNQAVTAADGLREALSDAAVAGGPRLIVWASRLFPPRTTSPRWNEPG